MGACRNVGGVDRAARFVVGVAALVLAFTVFGVTEGSVAGIALAVIGGVMLATALVRMCPLYIPFKVSTCKAGER